ncbi:MAG TPA: aminotransferase class V-fold PLP-dependent enzyme [Bacillota bacterium]|nr:aminotransferase class V-fold PLP-dependent enzyme [Bacillota bacterium]
MRNVHSQSATAAMSPLEVTNWRDQFPILANKIHLGNCSQSPISHRVKLAVDEYTLSLIDHGMDWPAWMSRVQEAKAQFARLIHADVNEVAVTMSVSDATAAVAGALAPHNGRRKVLTTAMEFPTVGHVWLANAQYGWDVEFLPERDGRLEMDDFARALKTDTALISVTHVSYQTGALTDIASLAQLAHSSGALLYVDAYQSLGTVPVDVRRDGIDFLSSGTLKYLLGIPGIAFLYVRDSIADELSPGLTGWFGQRDPFSMETTRLDYAPGTRRFDTGTPPVMAAYAAAAGIGIINEVGVDRIRDRLLKLSVFAMDAAEKRGFQVLGPKDPSERGASLPLRVNDAHAAEAALFERGIIASARGPALRLAPHFFSTEEDILTALEALSEITSTS